MKAPGQFRLYAKDELAQALHKQEGRLVDLSHRIGELQFGSSTEELRKVQKTFNMQTGRV